ncbi:putative nucleoporin protein Ndc1-Nup [Lyophyllum shimeji]|uniref:Nucleoporin protein Ndc1-Nup n=1 Tax=Lyophyllum shimeji TaxID=47721 RepID=A0A9P3PT93_LYOSH|nr:putative nucleoporin protein Ndc1-Nup [Lyophyllum shimeji]
MSTSLSRTTPTRAIISTLATRSAPSVPPSSTTYDPIVKSILRFRLLYLIFPYSALFCWACTSLWTIWSLRGPSGLGWSGSLLVPFRPSTFLIALLSWCTAAIPAVVLRKVYLTPTRTPAPSLLALVKTALAKPSTTRSFVVYAISAVVALALHIGILYANRSTTQGLGIFVKSKKHPYYLNGRLLFMLLTQLSTAMVFTFRNITLDRFVFRWERVSAQSPKTSRRRFNPGDIVQAVVIAAMLATLALPFAGLVFASFRATHPLLYKLPLLHNLLRPFTAHFLRGPWTVFLPLRHVYLLTRAWFLAFTTLAIWEFSNTIFDTIIYLPIIVSELTPEPHVTLVSGASSSDVGFRYLAYKELEVLASDDTALAAARRSLLFNEQKYNLSLWNRLARESLLFLGKDYQHFLRRGQPAPARPPPGPPATPATATRPSIATPTPLIRRSVFKARQPSSPIQTVVESLGSDGPLAQALDQGAEAAHIPELFRSVENAVLPEPTKEEVKKNVEKATGLVERVPKRVKEELRRMVARVVPKRVKEYAGRLGVWCGKERLERVTASYLPYREMDVVIVQVLSHLVCASLTEDKYGVVQRDIPKILEAMLSYLSAIEEYHAEVHAKYRPPAHDQTYTPEQIAQFEAARVEVEKAVEILNYVTDGLKEGVARIARTFGDKLLAFKFPPRIAVKLQPFLEYC